MNRILFFLFTIGFVNITNAQYSSITDQNHPNLVAFYLFEGNANDTTDFENNGIVDGAILTTDRFGNENSAYSFDGIDDIITVDTSSSLDITGELTISVWVQGASLTGSITAIVGKTNFDPNIESRGGMAPYGLGINNGTRLYSYIRNAEGNQAADTSGLTINLDQWYHYATTYKPSEYIRIYRNGILLHEVKNDIPDYIDSTNRVLGIGGRSESSNLNKGFYFQGKIDDIRIYNISLNDEEIVKIYNQESGNSVSIEPEDEIESFTLFQNYPNPFNPSTTIQFELQKRSFVQLDVYDITGKLVQSLVQSSLSSGSHSYQFIAGDLASGIYFYRLSTPDYSEIKKFTLIK